MLQLDLVLYPSWSAGVYVIAGGLPDVPEHSTVRVLELMGPQYYSLADYRYTFHCECWCCERLLTNGCQVISLV